MDAQKQKVGIAAAALVENGHTVGLGTGSTAAFSTNELGRRVREEGLSIRCVATSYDTAFLARQAGLDCLPLESVAEIDMSIDGADEIDPHFRLLKGGGGAHTREKLVHAMSRRFVLIADASKRVAFLGERCPVAIEILPAAMAFASRKLADLGAQKLQWRTAQGKCGPVVTDNGNWIIDARFARSAIEDPLALEESINQIPGVLENGIFAKLHPRAENCLIA